VITSYTYSLITDMKEVGRFCDDDVARALNVFTSRAEQMSVISNMAIVDIQTKNNVHEWQCSSGTH
jgi:hypothetical protein